MKKHPSFIPLINKSNASQSDNKLCTMSCTTEIVKTSSKALNESRLSILIEMKKNNETND